MNKLTDEMSKMFGPAAEKEMQSLQTILDASENRKGKAPLPIMAGNIADKFSLMMAFSSGLSTYNSSEKTRSHINIKNTLAAPITHGIVNENLTDLSPITLRQAVMKVNMIQTGKVIYVETKMDCYMVVATALYVEDRNGDAMQLNIYNYVRPEENPQQVFPNGSFLAVMNPYLRFSLGRCTYTY